MFVLQIPHFFFKYSCYFLFDLFLCTVPLSSAKVALQTVGWIRVGLADHGASRAALDVADEPPPAHEGVRVDDNVVKRQARARI